MSGVEEALEAHRQLAWFANITCTNIRCTSDAFGESYAHFASYCMLGAGIMLMLAYTSKVYCHECCGYGGKFQPKVMCPIFVACEPCLCPPEKPKVEEQQV